MPRYFFNVYDGVTILDPIGTVLPSLAEAKGEAFATAIETLRFREAEISVEDGWRVEVADANGKVLLTMKFTIEEAT